LSISNNVIGLEGIKSLSLALETCSLLEELYFDSCEVDTCMLDIFSVTVKKLNNLKKIGVAFNKLDSSAIAVIKNILQNGKITDLYLTGINISEEEADSLISEYITINLRI
jgi:hypothetical protein